MDDKRRKFRLEELRREIAIGIKEADRGEVAPLDIEGIKRKVRERLAQMGRRQQTYSSVISVSSCSRCSGLRLPMDPVKTL